METDNNPIGGIPTPATSQLRAAISRISEQSGIGDLDSPAANNLFGLNHRGYGGALQANTDTQGLTLFSRPRMNLSYDNVARSRILSPMLAEEENTYQQAIRLLLDPTLATQLNGIKSPLVDDRCAFIPILSNNLISLSGWPDVEVDTYTSTEGLQKESWSMVDGVYKYYRTFDVTANFRNIAGDPITLLLNTWVHYASMVYQDQMSPYMANIMQNKIDYTTRIWRLVLDSSNRFVQKIGCCGAAFPTAVPLGASFNFNSETPLNSENDQLSFNFRCMGAEYLDPILIYEFNVLVALFNPDMATEESRTAMRYIKLSQTEKPIFNYRGYPRIDPDSFELEWWVDGYTYDTTLAKHGLGTS